MPCGDIRIELRCLHVVSDSESTIDDILWQGETDLAPADLKIRPGGTGVPIRFTIPYTCTPSSPEDSDDQVVWRLKVRAELKGLDFAVGFEVPVFVTRDSRQSVQAVSDPAPRPIFKDNQGRRFWKNSTIKVEKNARGGCQIHFPANRAPGMVLWTGFTALVVIGVAGAVLHTDAPRFFPAMFGFFGLLFMFAAVSYAFRNTTVFVNPGNITVVNRTLGLGTTKGLSGEQVMGVYPVLYLDTPNRAYYQIKIRKKIGRPAVAGIMIPSKREAEWLVDEIMSVFEMD